MFNLQPSYLSKLGSQVSVDLPNIYINNEAFILELALTSGKIDITANNDSDLSDVHDNRENNSCIPGDSYPAVAASLDDIESDVNTDVEELENNDNKKQEPEYLLQKLRKGGNRMDQIKRQLVVQRGAIVAALKILAQSRAGSSGSLSSYKGLFTYYVIEK